LAEQLGPAVAVEVVPSPSGAADDDRRVVLDKLERGEINVQQALQELAR
jgi:hypothetical protein